VRWPRGTVASALMALAVARPYACPVCHESFTKWGVCQAHARTSAPCRSFLSEKLKDLDGLQELCRVAAKANVAPAPGGEPPERAPALDVKAPKAEPQSTIPAVVMKRLGRAVTSGYLSEEERRDLERKMEEWGSQCTEAVQVAAMDKFLGPSLGDFLWIEDKSSWLLRCLNFCARTNSNDSTAGKASSSALLLSALATQALLPDALEEECWRLYLESPLVVQRCIAGAFRSSILANTKGKLSDHFNNMCRNERAIFYLEEGPDPWSHLERDLEQLSLEEIEGSLYHRLLEQMRERRRFGEERLLQDLAEANAGIQAGERHSLLYTHMSTVEARKWRDAEDFSLLHVAAAQGLVRICARLLAEGLQVNERAGPRMLSALHLAAAHGEVEALKLLLQQRADPNICDAEGQTPLYGAVLAAAKQSEQGHDGRAKGAAAPRRLLLKACNVLLLGGAKNVPAGDSSGVLSQLDAEALAALSHLFDFRNLIRLHSRLGALRERFQIDDSIVAELMKLQYETAIFVIAILERHMSVSVEAIRTEFRALITSDFVQQRDQVQRLGNRLAKRLHGLGKKAICKLMDVPPEAGLLALQTWKVEEIVPHVYEVPDHLNQFFALPEPEAEKVGDAPEPAEEGETADLGAVSADNGEPADAATSDWQQDGQLSPSMLQGKVRKWDADRGFGFIVQDAVVAEETGKDIFVHRKNVVGSTSVNHIDLIEQGRVSFRVGEQDGRPRALEVRMIDSEGCPMPVHSLRGSQPGELGYHEGDEASGQEGESEGELTRKFLRHLRRPHVQQVAQEKRRDGEAFLRCLGVRRQGTGRRDDAMWRREIERRIDVFLARNTTPLLKRDFDFRVRRFLHEFCLHSSVTRVSEALSMVEKSTAGKGRGDVRSWPAYLATLLRRFDPKLYESLADRDKRSRLEQRKLRSEVGGMDVMGDGMPYDDADLDNLNILAAAGEGVPRRADGSERSSGGSSRGSSAHSAHRGLPAAGRNGAAVAAAVPKSRSPAQVTGAAAAPPGLGAPLSSTVPDVIPRRSFQ